MLYLLKSTPAFHGSSNSTHTHIHNKIGDEDGVDLRRKKKKIIENGGIENYNRNDHETK